MILHLISMKFVIKKLYKKNISQIQEADSEQASGTLGPPQDA